jgi:5-formyltetrahydrofolate cyclo-ligase
VPARARALSDGKRVYMAVPRLRSVRPFLLLDPAHLPGRPRAVASISGAARSGKPAAISEMEHVDLIVCGSVAVNRAGARVGKGGGFSDLEFALLVEAGRVDERTVIATTVHDRQLVDEELPETPHDFRVDLIVTPARVLRPKRTRRPAGVVWSDLDDEKIAAVPALSARAAARGGPPRGGGAPRSRRRA